MTNKNKGVPKLGRNLKWKIDAMLRREKAFRRYAEKAGLKQAEKGFWDVTNSLYEYREED